MRFRRKGYHWEICGIAGILDKVVKYVFSILIEDISAKQLVYHVMQKIKLMFPDKEILYDSKSFKGIGHLSPRGTVLQQKTGQLLNDLALYLRGFDRALQGMENTAVFIVLDNDKRNPVQFKQELLKVSRENMILIDHVYCVAIKEMEAWLLGDEAAIETAYPQYRKRFLAAYVQDEIGDTWEVLANVVYPGGLSKLLKEARNGYTPIGAAKTEWADRIGSCLDIQNNQSPSFNYFINELLKRVEAA